MKTVYNKLAAFTIMGVMLAACGTSNNVVSGKLISKRKVNKGFFINHPKNLKSDNADEQQANRQPFIQYQEEEATEMAFQSPASATIENEIFTATDAPLMTATDEVETVSTVETSPIRNAAPEKMENRPVKSSKIKNAEFRQAKKDFKHSNKSDSDVKLLILVIICLFIPPLAVYLHEGSWNTTCWINLLLTLLFFLPGLIHGLIVILKD